MTQKMWAVVYKNSGEVFDPESICWNKKDCMQWFRAEKFSLRYEPEYLRGCKVAEIEIKVIK
jgi:hypothetical protein